MYTECDIKRIKQYFGFINDYKPTTKNVIYTIYNKIADKYEKMNNIN